MAADKIMGNAWLAYAIGLYVTAHWIGGTVALGMTLILVFG